LRLKTLDKVIFPQLFPQLKFINLIQIMLHGIIQNHQS